MKETVEIMLRDENLRLAPDIRANLLQALTEGGIKGLQDYFDANPSACFKYGEAVRDHALRYVEWRLERLQEARSAGTLSAEESRVANKELHLLLDQVERMAAAGREKP